MRALPVILVLAVAGLAGAYEPAAELCTLADPRIPESSGIVASSHTDGVYFTHNDSGDGPRFFAFDDACRVLATVEVVGAFANDWEDIARGPGSNGGSALYLGDIGNNNRSRLTLVVYEVPEPVIDPSLTEQSLTVEVTRALPYQYADGPQDAEALMVEPGSGRIVVVSKAIESLSGLSGVYVLEPVLPSPAPLVARRIATLNLRLLGASDRLATGGDIAPDGNRLVVRTYDEAFEWAIPIAGLAEAFAGTPQRIALPDTLQGEAIGYSRDGAALLTTTEGAGPVHILR